MPSQIRKRLWCKHCNEWMLHLHHYPDWENWFCVSCKNKYEETPLSEIPNDKILEQQERYKEHCAKSSNKIFGELFMTPEERQLKQLMHMFKEPGSDMEITECDAGQEAINQEKRQKRQEVQNKIEKEKTDAKLECIKYKGLTRNDLCICGSTKKYKKCCLERIQKIMIDYNLRW